MSLSSFTLVLMCFWAKVSLLLRIILAILHLHLLQFIRPLHYQEE